MLYRSAGSGSCHLKCLVILSAIAFDMELPFSELAVLPSFSNMVHREDNVCCFLTLYVKILCEARAAEPRSAIYLSLLSNRSSLFHSRDISGSGKKRGRHTSGFGAQESQFCLQLLDRWYGNSLLAVQIWFYRKKKKQHSMLTPGVLSGLFFPLYINCNPCAGIAAALLEARQSQVIITVFQLS